MKLCLFALATIVCAASAAFPNLPNLRSVLPPTVKLPRTPDKCCLPIEYHIRRRESSLYRHLEGADLVTEHSHIAGDKKALKIAENGTILTENQPMPLHYSYIVDFHEQKVFFIDRVRDCSYERKVHELKYNSCIPEKAEYQGTAVVGEGESNPGVRVDVWHWTEGTEPEPVTHHMVGVTEKDCTPVGRAFNVEDKFEHADYNSFARFYDNEVGRIDPDVFRVPKECRRVGAEHDAFMRSLNKFDQLHPRKLFSL